MATYGPVNLPAFLSGDADFRTWCQGVHTALTSIGLVQTADTGQLVLATATRPGANNTAAGYEIFRLSDALQASTPIFVKIEYGIAGAVDRPQLWITTGSATNGAGTLSSSTLRIAAGQTVSKTAGVLLPVYASGDGSRFALAFSIDTASASSFMGVIAVERTRDASGQSTVDGWIASAAPGPGGGSSATRPGVANATSTNGPLIPVHNSLGLATDSVNNGVGTMVYFLGRQCYGIGLTCMHFSTSPGAAVTFIATVLGVAHTFMCLSNKTSVNPSAFNYAGDVAQVVGILWE